MHPCSDIKKVYCNSEYLMVMFITPVLLLNSLGFAQLVQETNMHCVSVLITCTQNTAQDISCPKKHFIPKVKQNNKTHKF